MSVIKVSSSSIDSMRAVFLVSFWYFSTWIRCSETGKRMASDGSAAWGCNISADILSQISKVGEQVVVKELILQDLKAVQQTNPSRGLKMGLDI